MIIRDVIIRKLEMTMKNPFSTSFGTMQTRQFLIIEVVDEKGNKGFGEGVAFSIPWYTEETTNTSIHMIRDFLVPMLKGRTIQHPDEVNGVFKSIRKNNMAKAAVECAVWDCWAKRQGITLTEAIGGKKEKIDVGISIGLQSDFQALAERIHQSLESGFKRIKVKIKPGHDMKLLSEIRERFPDVPLMADANSAYTLDDLELLKKLDQFNLLMIEQPLASDDIVDHATLQKQIRTPICLDESILSAEDARKAIQLGSCGVINVKIGRVGGMTEAKRIHDICQESGIPVWCGGMLEAGIGRAHNIALTTLPNFTLPGDTAGSSSYWERDIISPEITVEDGTITVSQLNGIGYEVDLNEVERHTTQLFEIRL
ncbi:o-succinylbenzoate synthase [Sporosarcina gallistercoris]|uniref:o-succinylbenzoate synthase n=1 Tax=Sporosarcina gallistercoris TaxID=2762245 RepID=A0ABR8PFT7_9BACL|nr:o-succinylbenzoate synthase [Sporosarcina gallistercoris]MBD7907037.1 o-succinylbenzoate synthase [Sporosarcina gallistercoris]